MFEYHLILKGNQDFMLANSLIQYNPICILLGPLLYLHIKFQIDKTSKISYFNVHLLPAVLIFVILGFYKMLPFDQKINFERLIHVEFINSYNVPLLFSNSKMTLFAMAIVSLLYLSYSFFLIISNLEFGVSKSREQLNHKLTVKWLFWLLIFSVFIFIVFALPFFPLKKIDNDSYFIFFGASGIHLLIIYLMFCPYVLYGSNNVDLPIINAMDNVLITKSKLIIPEKLIIIDHLILEYLKSAPFTKSDFNLNKVSLDLGIPRYKLTYYLNNHLMLSFNAWRDLLRINYAKSLLVNGAANTFTLESIGKDSGYQSRDKFTRAFKAQTGLSPSEFSKKI